MELPADVGAESLGSSLDNPAAGCFGARVHEGAAVEARHGERLGLNVENGQNSGFGIGDGIELGVKVG
ncbi:MAG TPA: hypothetical protein VE400_00970 [Mycobacterium sp.]|jgi:hypothetical protein|nr:hypothetical protein [Mycobacterium sp.]